MTTTNTPYGPESTLNIVRYTTFLRRLASLPSHAEFSKYWSRHAELVAPWFVFHNVLGCTQTHLAPSAQQADAKTLAYDGMVDLYFNPDTCSMFNTELWRGKDFEAADRYFEEVVLVDEKRFWDRTGQANVKGELGWESDAFGLGVMGYEKKVIVDGKIVIDVSKEVMDRWESYLGAE